MITYKRIALHRRRNWRCLAGRHERVRVQDGVTTSGAYYERDECSRGCGTFWWLESANGRLTSGHGRERRRR